MLKSNKLITMIHRKEKRNFIEKISEVYEQAIHRRCRRCSGSLVIRKMHICKKRHQLPIISRAKIWKSCGTESWGQ